MTENQTTTRVHIIVSGSVQGVGFRVFAQNLAMEYTLTGYVRNSKDAVEIEAQGSSPAIDLFLDNLKYKAPRAALIQSVDVRYIDVLPGDNDDFKILNTIHEG